MFPLISFFLCFTGVALYPIVMVCSVPSFVYFLFSSVVYS